MLLCSCAGLDGMMTILGPTAGECCFPPAMQSQCFGNVGTDRAFCSFLYECWYAKLLVMWTEQLSGRATVAGEPSLGGVWEREEAGEGRN